MLSLKEQNDLLRAACQKALDVLYIEDAGGREGREAIEACEKALESCESSESFATSKE